MPERYARAYARGSIAVTGLLLAMVNDKRLEHVENCTAFSNRRRGQKLRAYVAAAPIRELLSSTPAFTFRYADAYAVLLDTFSSLLT